MEHPINILERYWKFTSFRGHQEAIINAVIEGEDTFALMPTGGGKSICFQVPALAKKGICIVISPLIALMQDQVKSLNNKGIKAMALTSGISYNELDTKLDNCVYGNYKFLYLSPERLQQEVVQSRIKQMHVNLIAVDEAHCISQWGNDFRPAYKNIAILRQIQPTANVIALTASATPEVVKDIIKELDFINPKLFKQSFFRSNLAYMVFHEEDKLYKVEAILKKYKAPSIIYVRNRKLTNEISSFLNSKNISSTTYHGGLNNHDKATNMNNWLNNKNQVMVATNAFGMGIDKPDVKTVIHISLPESIESYFQEAGRAGRNGEKAFAIILKNNSDELLIKNQFLKVLPSVNMVKQVYRKLCSYFQISYGEGEFETFDFDFYTFNKTYNFNATLCYNALLLLDRNSIISLSKQFKNKVKLQFITTNNTLFNYLEQNPKIDIIVKSILRMYGGIFDNETAIDLNKVVKKSSASAEHIIEILQNLKRDEIITLSLNKTDAQITFIEPREDDKTINRIAKTIKKQNKQKQKQVTAMLNYTENNEICKSEQLLSYFGEKNTKPCGVCSVCLNLNGTKTNNATFNLKIKIVELLQNQDLSSRVLQEHLKCTPTELKQNLQLLLEQNIIKITESNTYKLSHL
ncbi:RecQ family ATP-dependent DNA helicase [Neotamlana laminarinivorans]|uniref:ATP-dependent DNA helicase RecQ n=1 Tax=Neotamlana laminarinivorans TaxID=2883124 RepID=A0A9X1HZL0_9FLAO|nr:RecQ family ATP-dependent DNA helicase [Tamlana laminarinivorans]MCB4797432.1 RecQ family ATP-dependent DNA helicase [Tamlana laminarinivorans]